MFGPRRPDTGQDFVFPDWSPYTRLDEAARAYFRDPEVALDALHGVIGDAPVLGFTLERMVSDDGLVWQEAVVCDPRRIVLWHGEDVPDDQVPQAATSVPDEGAPFPQGAMTSSIRVVPISRVSEVGYRTLLVRDGAPDGAVGMGGTDGTDGTDGMGGTDGTDGTDGGHRVHGVDVYILLEAVDEAMPVERDGESLTVVRHDAIRLGKSTEVGGPGQMARLSAFAQLVASLAGVTPS